VVARHDYGADSNKVRTRLSDFLFFQFLVADVGGLRKSKSDSPTIFTGLPGGSTGPSLPFRSVRSLTVKLSADRQ